MPHKIVVTGFGPFGEHETNPSAEVAKYLGEHPPSDCEVETKEMRVNYDEVAETVPQLWDNHNPDLVIHIGVHSVARCIKLERQAFPNGYQRCDVDGKTPCDAICVPSMDHVLKCTIDVDGLVEKTREILEKRLPKDFSIEASDDPGRYLCGFSYYLSLCKDNSKALFIHIPVVDDEVTVPLLASVVSTVITNILNFF